jgi:hypothetical protein
VTATRNGELAGDRRENGFDLITEPDQDRDGDHGNESQNQSVFDQRLTFPVPLLAEYVFHYSKMLTLPTSA